MCGLLKQDLPQSANVDRYFSAVLDEKFCKNKALFGKVISVFVVEDTTCESGCYKVLEHKILQGIDKTSYGKSDISKKPANTFLIGSCSFESDNSCIEYFADLKLLPSITQKRNVQKNSAHRCSLNKGTWRSGLCNKNVRRSTACFSSTALETGYFTQSWRAKVASEERRCLMTETEYPSALAWYSTGSLDGELSKECSNVVGKYEIPIKVEAMSGPASARLALNFTAGSPSFSYLLVTTTKKAKTRDKGEIDFSVKNEKHPNRILSMREILLALRIQIMDLDRFGYGDKNTSKKNLFLFDCAMERISLYAKTFNISLPDDDLLERINSEK